MDVPYYVYGAGGYAVLGLGMALAYRLGPNFRQSSWVHLATVAISALGLLPALAVALADEGTLIGRTFGEYHRSARGLLFLAAGFCHMPVWIYIGVFHAGRWIEHLHTRTADGGPETPKKTRRQEWEAARTHLEALAKNPLDARRREALAESYISLGSIEGAIREYRKAIECVDRGYDQSRLMYKAIRLVVEKQGGTEEALPLIRRLIRLYPKSYFSAYARRVLNQYETHRVDPRSSGTRGTGAREPGPERREDSDSE